MGCVCAREFAGVCACICVCSIWQEQFVGAGDFFKKKHGNAVRIPYLCVVSLHCECNVSLLLSLFLSLYMNM